MVWGPNIVDHLSLQTKAQTLYIVLSYGLCMNYMSFGIKEIIWQKWSISRENKASNIITDQILIHCYLFLSFFKKYCKPSKRKYTPGSGVFHLIVLRPFKLNTFSPNVFSFNCIFKRQYTFSIINMALSTSNFETVLHLEVRNSMHIGNT